MHYVRQRLGVSAAGFGLLLSASAAGGLADAALAGPLSDRFGAATLLRAGLVVETGVHLVLALTRNGWVAGAVMVAFGAHTAVWGVVATTVRQRLVPDRLRGRVGSVYFLLVMGGSALGALVGGFLARGLGLAARSGSPPPATPSCSCWSGAGSPRPGSTPRAHRTATIPPGRTTSRRGGEQPRRRPAPSRLSPQVRTTSMRSLPRSSTDDRDRDRVDEESTVRCLVDEISRGTDEFRLLASSTGHE